MGDIFTADVELRPCCGIQAVSRAHFGVRERRHAHQAVRPRCRAETFIVLYNLAATDWLASKPLGIGRPH